MIEIVSLTLITVLKETFDYHSHCLVRLVIRMPQVASLAEIEQDIALVLPHLCPFCGNVFNINQRFLLIFGLCKESHNELFHFKYIL